MTDQIPGYVVALVFFMIVVTIATVGAFIAGFMVWLWTAWKQHKRDQGEDEGEGGGWTNKPSGTPPGGGDPDRDLDRQFHAIADAIGKTIKIGEKDEEKVLT